MKPTQYPDVSELLKAKEAHRERLARLSFEEKIAIVEQMRQAFPKKLSPVQKKKRLVGIKQTTSSSQS